MAHMGPTLANSTNRIARCLLTLGNKIVFQIWKDYLRIIFLMAKKDLFYSSSQLVNSKTLKTITGSF